MKDHSTRVWVILVVTALGLLFMAPPVHLERVGSKFLREHDSDADGRIAPQEYPADAAESASFSELDLDGNGYLTRAELANRPSSWPRWLPQAYLGKSRLKKGIDLKGGTILVYQVDTQSQTGPLEMDRMVAALSKRINPTGTVDVTIRPMGDRIELILPEADPQEVDAIQRRVTTMGRLEFRILANEKHDAAAIREAIEKRRRNEDPPPSFQWVKLQDPDELGAGGGLAVEDGYVLTKIPGERMLVTGDELTRAQPTTDRELKPAIGFNFNSRGAMKFGRLTRQYQPESDGFQYHLAILLDEVVMTAPVINEPIEGGQGEITRRGGFSPEEVDDKVAVLNAGKLPASLIPTPISKDTVTATLGDDTVRMGRNAIFVSMIAVPIFMLFYYRFAGLVANVALLLNLILIIGFMGFTESSFTLPGLAGLALTIGMAVDANVLIFERIREEHERGSSLNQAVRNGFERAWFAIFDSNLTTIFTGAILWWLGTDQIKGFAITLVFGLVANLFTAVFVSRTIFEIWLKKGWLTHVKMLHLIKTPSLDYVGPRYYFIVGSAVVVAIGLSVTAVRGSNVLDIDFTGGTAISVRLTKEAEAQHGNKLADFVREMAGEAVNDAGERVLPNVKVERLNKETEEEPLFLVRTTNKTQREVRAAIIRQFHEEGGVLATVRIVEPWQVEPMPATTTAPADSADENASQETNSAESPAATEGHRVTFSLTRETNRNAIQEKFDQVLQEKGFSEPGRHYTLRAEKSGTLPNTFVSFVLETKEDVASLLPAVSRLLEQEPIFERENNFDSQVAGETKTRAIFAMVLSWVVMVAYLWFRFKNASYGLAAVVALVHDVLIALGFVVVGGWIARLLPGATSWLLIDDFKIDLTMVTAFMTIIGYSVNDTIVIFDRLREIRGKTPYVTPDMINKSVNQCMSRTLLTSLTVIVVVAIMYIFGGPGIHGFSFAMLIGCLSGTYSTIFIAAPILILFEGQRQPATSPKGLQYQGAAARA